MYIKLLFRFVPKVKMLLYCIYRLIYALLYEVVYLTIIELMMWPCGNRLLKRLMSPSQKSEVMFASAFSWIGDFFVFSGSGTSWLSLVEESLVILKSMRHTSITLWNRSTERERDHRDAGESEQDCGTLSRCHDAHVGRQLGFSESSVRRTIDSNALDGSEYFMVSDKLFKIVGAEMLEFREALQRGTPGNNCSNDSGEVNEDNYTTEGCSDQRIIWRSPRWGGKVLFDCKCKEIGD